MADKGQDIYEAAAPVAWAKVREKAKKDPCYLCEQTDCEGCEYSK